MSFPLEDLYRDEQKAGSVGQEIYGCGGAFTFAARAFFYCGNAPFRLFCDYPAIPAVEDDTVMVKFFGPPGYVGRMRVLQKGRRALRGFAVRSSEGHAVEAKKRALSFREYEVKADATYIVTWDGWLTLHLAQLVKSVDAAASQVQ